MNLAPLLLQLNRNGVTYLAGITPSKRCVIALRIAQTFFNKNNFVPGFGELLIVTAEKNKVFRITSRRGFNFDYLVCTPDNIPSKYKPDLVWVDDLPTEDLKKITIKFSHLPLLLTNEPSKNGLQILVDSREQSPLFKGNEFKRSTLYVGDYTTEKLLDKFHIERKSPLDLYGTITKGHRRFRDELIRAQVVGIELVMIVECKKKKFIQKEFAGSSVLALSCDHVEKIINTVEKKYKLPIYWCNSREHCVRLIKKLFKSKQLFYGRKKS